MSLCYLFFLALFLFYMYSREYRVLTFNLHLSESLKTYFSFEEYLDNYYRRQFEK